VRPSVAPEGGQSRPARERRRQVRMDGLPLQRGAPARDQPVDRLHRQLEQQAGQGLPGLRQPLGRAVAAASEAADRRACAPAQQTLANVLSAANAAATEDVRIVELWPTLKRVLDRGKAPNAATKQVAALLQAWHDAGGSRRDADHDGKIDDPGVPILDAAWKGLTDAGLCDRLGTALCKQLEGRNRRFDAPPGGQYGGWHQYTVEGPARATGPEGRGRLPPALLRRRQREDLLARAVGGPRRRAQAPGVPTGRRSEGVARARGQGADHLRPDLADHDAVHEQADGHPPGDAIRALATQSVGAGGANGSPREGSQRWSARPRLRPRAGAANCVG
jgi:hypothetical protein